MRPDSPPFDRVSTWPTKRKPRRAMVRISFWPSPLSPTAFRAALMRLVKVDSDTIRPSQTEVIRSSITGKGLKEAVAGVQVASDLANSPSFEDKAVLEFFETSGRNLLAAEAAAGVRHHVALSIVGTDRSDNGYFRAKVAQEKLIVASGIPYTIIRSTQFLEFLRGIADSSADG